MRYLSAQISMIAREIKEAVMTVLLESIQNSNAGNGFGWPVNRVSLRARRMMHDNGIRINDCSVTQHDKKVAVIHRKYAQHKVRLCYKELKPTIEWED